MIARIFGFLLLIWAFGFLWFAAVLPGPAGEEVTDAVVVPTGGPGRIARGLEILEDDQAELMLVSGVDREVTANEFATEFNVPRRFMRCCITLGQAAVDTRSNAAETVQWVRANNVESLRLVTTDWHMRRATSELIEELPGDIRLIRDAVPSEPSLKSLFLEYHKLLASAVSRLWPD